LRLGCAPSRPKWAAPDAADWRTAIRRFLDRPAQEPATLARDRARSGAGNRHRGDRSVIKALPDQMFTTPENSRLTMLRTWVLDHEVTGIEMKERQFWNFAALQPVAEKPWTTFMGRLISVPDMPEAAQKQLGVFDKNSPGMI
jgi:hypothetical protein